MARHRCKLTQTEREQRRRRDRERLAEAIRELLTSDGWKGWLRARATLHGYSLHNTVLLAQEARRRGFQPTHVAGFRAWLKLGRCVRKGERGLPILAPIKLKERDSDGEADERQIVFRTVHVFDVSQTDPLPGVEPAPLTPPRQPLTGSSHSHLLEPLEQLAGRIGYTVTYPPLPRVDGLCDRRGRLIAIDADLAANAKVAALVHELAHARIERELDGQQLSRQLEELVVEAVTYVALAAAGLDTGPDSVPYIASWQGDNTVPQLQRTAERIDGLARWIEATIAPKVDPESELALRNAA